MGKRILAVFLIALFIAAVFPTVAEVQGHFTLGEQTESGPIRNGKPWPDHSVGDLGNHVEKIYGWYDSVEVRRGPVAYVTPGLGYVPPDQQMMNYYSPDGAIVTDSTGGLTFYINVTDLWPEIDVGPEISFSYFFNITWEADRWLYVAIPPEFTPLGDWENGETTNAKTSITNDYALIKTGKLPNDDEVAPGWWYVAVSAATDPLHGHQGVLWPPGKDPYPDRQVRSGDFAGCYWIWTGGLKAPSCAGKYFFKIFNSGYYCPICLRFHRMECIPFENFPVLLVKGELDPGYIQGRILYGGNFYYGYFYGDPIEDVGGRVIAEGEAIDPVTNEPTGRKVCAVGYFSEDAEGYYEIEGLAPGIYTLTAEAAGFPPVTLATEITVKRGQSIHGVDIYLYPGAKIQLKVNSKCPTGAVPWPDYLLFYDEFMEEYYIDEDYIAIELLDEEGNTVIPRLNMDMLEEFWPEIEIIEEEEYHFEIFMGEEDCYAGIGAILDGHIPQFHADWISGLPAGVYYPKVYVFGYVQLEEYPVVVPSAQYTGVVMREMDVFQGGKVHATIHFHNQEMPSADEAPLVGGDLIIEAYDTEGNLRGWNATTTPDPPYPENETVTLDVLGDPLPNLCSGMPAGTYTFKVWYPGYAQQEFPQHTVQLCEWGSFSFHLVKGANITVTVYSRDWQSPAQPLPWLHPDAHLRVYFYNSAREMVGWKGGNQRTVLAEPDREHFWFDGMHWTIEDYIRYGFKPSGLPTDIYSINAYTVGYVQKMVPEVWSQKASSTGDIPLYLYAGAKIMCTVNFKIEELFAPLPDDQFSFYFRINVYDEEGNLAAANITSVPQATSPSQPNGVQTWVFEVVGFGGSTTPGWLGDPFSVGKWLDTTGWTAAEPVETSWIPYDRFGYWEPTSIEATEEGYHYDYGIPEGTYTVEVIDETNGYVQTATVSATVSWMGYAMLFFDMHKQAWMSGTVYQRNYMGDFRTASWYTVEISGSPEITTYTADGDFGVWVPAGTYTFRVHLLAPDHTDAVVMQERTVVVTWGASATGQDFYMEEGGVPIPEFPSAGVLMLISALAASLYLLRWRRQAVIASP